MKDILSTQFIWPDGGAGPQAPAPTIGGFVGILQMAGVWISGAGEVAPPAPPAAAAVIAGPSPGLRTATLTGVGL